MEKNIPKRLLLSALALLCISTFTVAQTPIDSVDTYHDQIVSNTVSVQGRHVLTVSNVTVTPTGYLRVSSPDGIIIPGGLTVEFGGVLNLDITRRRNICYVHDSSGNIIKRSGE